ncbi:hypothetical protein JCM8202_005895 [Rhodotorula sphaerocarpa]
MAVIVEEPAIPSALSSAAEQLKETSGLSVLGESGWAEVALAGRALADGLQSNEVRSLLGRNGVVEACGRLLQLLAHDRKSSEGEQIGVRKHLLARIELTRIVGNLCFEHDENRQRVLDAGIPLAIAQNVLNTLGCGSSYPEGSEGGPAQGRLDLDEVRFVRAGAGAFLNSSLQFDPMRRELARREVVTALLALLDMSHAAPRTTRPVYVTSEWAYESDEKEQERREIASTAVRWAANVLEDVLAADKSTFPPGGVQILSSVVFSLSASASRPALRDAPDDAEDWLDTDIELSTIAASLLESVCLESDEMKSTIALSAYDAAATEPPPRLLARLLDFIQDGVAPTTWSDWTYNRPRTAKAFSAIKASVVRAVVETPNSDEVMQQLWSETRPDEPNWLVERLVGWLRDAKLDDGREDLLICAAHMLASLGRRDEYTLALVRDYGLAPPLAEIVRERVSGAIGKTGRPGETTQILFGVVSLLRHLAIPLPNRETIGQTGIIPVVGQLLRPELDVVQPLQLAAVGLLKHLCYPNISNVATLLAPQLLTTSTDAPTKAALDYVVELVGRIDDVRLRSEATRVVVNCVRTLLAAPVNALGEESRPQADAARQRLAEPDTVGTIAGLVRTSRRHPMLVNEGVVALALLAAGDATASSTVLDSLVATPARAMPKDEAIAPAMNALSLKDEPPATEASSTADSASAAATLATFFDRPDGEFDRTSARPDVPAEVLNNIVNLLAVVTSAAKEDDERTAILRHTLSTPLRAASAEALQQDPPASWSSAATRLLSAWESRLASS